MSIGDYVKLCLADGTIIEGTVVKMGQDHVVIDEVRAFGDWVWIELVHISDIEIL